jgi:hypothetical protein
MATSDSDIEQLRSQVTMTIKRGTDLLGDLAALDDRLGVLLPSLEELPQSEREAFVARLCGYDPDMRARLAELVEGLADVVAGLTATDGGAAWLRHHLDRLAQGDAEEAA